MDIHNIVKQQFDKNECFKNLPRAVKIAYTEIELYEKEKIKKMMKEEEEAKNIIIMTVLQKKEDLKKTFVKIGGSSANSFAFSAYVNALHKIQLNKSISTIDLFNAFTDENIFIYVYNHCIKYLTLSFNDVNLCNMFKLYLIDDDLKILDYIFLRGAKINTSDFNSKVRCLKYAIKINDEYFVFFDDRDFRHNNCSLIVKKMIPKRDDDKNITLYHYGVTESARFAYNIINQLYDANKFIHIELFDNFFFV